MANGKIEGVVPKSFLLNYGEFYEKDGSRRDMIPPAL